MQVAFTIDLEQDCPPYLDTYRGAEEGMPRLLAILRVCGVRATVFSTGDVARRYPDLMRAIVANGHELGCHGDSHRAFDRMEDDDVGAELQRASATLRAFGPVRAFRAPYLRMPRRALARLRASAYAIDSSEATYKSPGVTMRDDAGLVRVPASAPSSLFRLPLRIRGALLGALSPPLVLFVHPWELVDLRQAAIRWDCRVATGPYAARAIADALGRLRCAGASFHTVSGLVKERWREDPREHPQKQQRDTFHG